MVDTVDWVVKRDNSIGIFGIVGGLDCMAFGTDGMAGGLNRLTGLVG